MTETRLLVENAYYHVYIRGNQKQKVFLDEEDFEFYLAQLYRYKLKYSFHIYGYCLMPNHIHLVGEPETAKKLSKFMQCLHRSYTSYFNNKYGKVGHLWQGRFKSKVINKDNYAVNCINYVELNPVRAGIVANPGDYKFSSYRGRVLNKNSGKKLLDELIF
ncbi:MAG: transposase [Candidatus Omnitrophica bacterium]|jgi:putative transposase|nr:transposase [Candidatus Omnitrophota bacterium]